MVKRPLVKLGVEAEDTNSTAYCYLINRDNGNEAFLSCEDKPERIAAVKAKLMKNPP